MIPSIPYKSLAIDPQLDNLLLFMADGITNIVMKRGHVERESGCLNQGAISALSDELTAEEAVAPPLSSRT